jgi:hypothetical protein
VVDGREGKEVRAGMITLRVSRLMICTIWVESVEFGIEVSIEAHDGWKPHTQKLSHLPKSTKKKVIRVDMGYAYFSALGTFNRQIRLISM